MRARLIAVVGVVAVVAAATLTAGARAGGETPRRVQCGQPERLRLQRFEDGSAKLWCGRRVLIRVAVPW